MKYLTGFAEWWIGLTVIYLTLGIVPASHTFVFLIGLFVPYGILNFVAASTGFMQLNISIILSTLLFLTAIFGADWAAKKLGISTTLTKIIFNLAVLFILTFIIDYSIYGEWNSLKLLMGWHPLNNVSL
jgi:hypothetical protein